MTKQGSRLPKNRRAAPDQRPAMRVTARDVGILALVCDYGALTTPMIAMLLRGTKDAPVSSRLRLRLKLLFHGGYLDRFPLHQPARGGAVFVYVPDTRGAELVAKQRGLVLEEVWRKADNQRVRGHVEHLLEINQVRAALTIGSRDQGVSLTSWQDDLAFRRNPIRVCLPDIQDPSSESELVPDGFCLAHSARGVMGLALELDRGTETVRSGQGSGDWVAKCRKYLYWYHRGDYAERVGVKGLRVLVVTTGDRRLANLKRAVESLGDRSMFYFARFEEAKDPQRILQEPLWYRAGSDGLFCVLD